MTGLLTRAIARLLLPASLVTALAILVKGYVDVGDGFAAGSVAATGLVLQYLAFDARTVERALPVAAAPATVVGGLLLVLAVAFAPVLAGQPPLTHFPSPGETVHQIGTLELHTAVIFDVGVFLLVVGFVVGTVRAIARTRAGTS